MPLNLYRRHRAACEAHHPAESRSGEFEERKKTWKRCACFIFVSGTLAGQFRRKYTGKTEWAEAKAVVTEWERAGNWTGVAPAPAPQPKIDTAPGRITIEQAIQSFTAEFGANAAINTQKKYRLLLGKVRTFSEKRGFLLIDQWKPIDVRDFRASWTVSPQTAAKNMSTIKTFFEFCLSNEWVTRNPARLVKNPRTRDGAERRNEQKLPFTDHELKLMYEVCETRYGKKDIVWSRDTHHKPAIGEPAQYIRKWSGSDLSDWISLAVYTGLRISDVSTFNADRLQPSGEVLVRTTKAGTHVYTWIPEWLQERIRGRAVKFGPQIFGTHTTKDLNVITDLWRRKLKKMWELCGEWSVTPTPHRFRHTFARILLQRGVSVRDVADLLGNSEEMVRRHYAAWIPERQERLTSILKDAFIGKPKPRAEPS
ncbi:MAG TPA: tyrosine-type recombinase/integrase [Bryobacteraceae bacterium]|jgi:site-specific recombinase XerD